MDYIIHLDAYSLCPNDVFKTSTRLNQMNTKLCLFIFQIRLVVSITNSLLSVSMIKVYVKKSVEIYGLKRFESVLTEKFENTVRNYSVRLLISIYFLII